mmetsp:Transcript_28065/g.58496  ORF Transcript_28065/g.58496 Transcript_28065/m.58496 type:complete len:218 (-) Transcript_28065:1296-1949(-)
MLLASIGGKFPKLTKLLDDFPSYGLNVTCQKRPFVESSTSRETKMSPTVLSISSFCNTSCSSASHGIGSVLCPEKTNEKVAPTREDGSIISNLTVCISYFGWSTLMCENFPSVTGSTSHPFASPIRFEVSTTKLGTSPSNVSNETTYLKLKSPCTFFSTPKVEMFPIEESRACFNRSSSASHGIGGVDKLPSLIANVPPLALLLKPVVMTCCSVDTA